MQQDLINFSALGPKNNVKLNKLYLICNSPQTHQLELLLLASVFYWNGNKQTLVPKFVKFLDFSRLTPILANHVKSSFFNESVLGIIGTDLQKCISISTATSVSMLQREQLNRSS